MLSVVTATYNRSKLLPNLYASILKNRKKKGDIEWVIIDDGSMDDTKYLVKKWQQEKKINITYLYQENQGKMQALNKGIPLCQGDYIIEVDSDDYLLEDVLEKIDSYNGLLTKNKGTYALGFLRKVDNGLSTNFSQNGMISSMYELYMKHNYQGEIALVFKQSIRKKFKHKLENGEKFITEARMYHEMDKKYQGIICVNEYLVGGVYEQDGYTKNIAGLFKKNPKGYYQYFLEILNFPNRKVSLKKYWYVIKQYLLFTHLLKMSKKECKQNLEKWYDRLLVGCCYFVAKKKTKQVFSDSID